VAKKGQKSITGVDYLSQKPKLGSPATLRGNWGANVAFPKRTLDKFKVWILKPNRERNLLWVPPPSNGNHFGFHEPRSERVEKFNGGGRFRWRETTISIRLGDYAIGKRNNPTRNRKKAKSIGGEGCIKRQWGGTRERTKKETRNCQTFDLPYPP